MVANAKHLSLKFN